MERKDRSEWKKTCIWHCAGCGMHFHGLNAFDAHRPAGVCLTAGETVRLAKKQSKVVRPPHANKTAVALPTGFYKALQTYTDDGYCDLTLGCYIDGKYQHHVHPVTIYQLAGKDETISD